MPVELLYRESVVDDESIERQEEEQYCVSSFSSIYIEIRWI